MIQSMEQLLENGSIEVITEAMAAALKRSDEAPFWSEKALPLAHAALSVLVPLRDRHLLFTPEGKPASKLTPELLLRWCDLMCLKSLAFTLKKSNQRQILHGTKYDDTEASGYKAVDLDVLNAYLAGYSVDLHNEFADFPITHYNLHIGISDVIKKLL